MRYEISQQITQRLDECRIAVKLERAIFLHQSNAGLANVAGDDSGERSPQTHGQLVGRLVLVKIERCHIFMGRLERLLELVADRQHPIKEISVIILRAEFSDIF